MVRRAYIFGTVALGLALAALDAPPALVALESSALHVERYVRGVQVTSNTLSPVERLVFGLVSANADSAPQKPSVQSTPGVPRT